MASIKLVNKIFKELSIYSYVRDPLFRNSSSLVLTRVLNVAAGFLFWMIAARIYSIEDVGIATVLISSTGLIILFSRFGFDLSVLRFLPTMEKSEIINTCLIVTTIATFIVGFIYIYFINYFAPELSFLQSYYGYIFIILTALSSIEQIVEYALIASRKSGQYLLQNIMTISRIPFLIPLAFMGSLGIISSMGLGYVLAILFAIFSLKVIMKLNFRINKIFIQKSLRFALGSYVSSVLTVAPSLILPIMVMHLIGATESARYFIALSVSNLVLIIPDSLSISLLVEGSHGENLRNKAMKACLVIYLFLIPAVVFLYFFGGFLLDRRGRGPGCRSCP